jgi:hypothetical protein
MDLILDRALESLQSAALSALGQHQEGFAVAVEVGRRQLQLLGVSLYGPEETVIVDYV